MRATGEWRPYDYDARRDDRVDESVFGGGGD